MQHEEPTSVDKPDRGIERFRHYLLLLARMRIGGQYHGKLDASDIVQQALLAAHKNIEQFRGSTDAELAAWMREILATSLAKAMRDLGRAKRDVARERSLQADFDASSARLECFLATDCPSPSHRVSQQEQLLNLAHALTQLSDKVREAMLLRHCQGWTLQKIADRLECTPPAVAGLLTKGAKELRSLMGD